MMTFGLKPSISFMIAPIGMLRMTISVLAMYVNGELNNNKGHSRPITATLSGTYAEIVPDGCPSYPSSYFW
jgi:hypothetical protein